MTTTVDIRALTTPSEYRACVAFQHEIWGRGFEAVPAAILQVAIECGGIVAGAFDAHDRLAGFVFGLTGLGDENRVIHWSHMLGVRPELRDAGVGRRLKEYQRGELARRRIDEMYWTYDPLIAKNAHFNLNVLGARVVRYVTDMYGKTGSPLHHGMPTDRLVVVTDTSRPQRNVSPTLEPSEACIPVLSARPRPDEPVITTGTPSPLARLEIPTDFARLLTKDPEEARHWHAATRRHFQWALDSGYSITGLRRDPNTSRSFYMLEAHQ